MRKYENSLRKELFNSLILVDIQENLMTIQDTHVQDLIAQIMKCTLLLSNKISLVGLYASQTISPIDIFNKGLHLNIYHVTSGIVIATSRRTQKRHVGGGGKTIYQKLIIDKLSQLLPSS